MGPDFSNAKHISLDFWGTLATSNVSFTAYRDIILGSWAVRDAQFSREAYKKVKTYLDEQAQTSSFHTVDDCFQLLRDELNCKDVRPFFYQLEELKVKLWQAFSDYPPEILPEIIEELRRIKAKGITLSIGSNTNFIPGKVIRECLLDKLELFDFFVYSDELGCTKPLNTFFKHIDNLVYSLNPNIPRKSIFHIGDSNLFDVYPAEYFGFSSVLVKNPQDLSQILRKF